MELTGLHLLLTYQCTFECDHCFVWGSPWQSGVMTLDNIREILRQAGQVSSMQSIYFEGGEPFLYYPVLAQGVKEAAQRGFRVGIVSNAYWATTLEDALAWLEPFAGLLSDLTVSSDLYHYDELVSRQSLNAAAAARQLGIPVGSIAIAQPEEVNASQADSVVGQLPAGLGGVMYRGRAVEKLARRARLFPWQGFTTCPHEDLREPGRVHLDPFGNLHICQGIVIGNLFQQPLHEICDAYDPEQHTIVAPLLAGGPAGLAQTYGVPPDAGAAYADACHLCYVTRLALRSRFPAELAPDQMYGIGM